MATPRQSGSGGALQFVWQGATVQQAWLAQIADGMQAEAAEIETALRSSIHVISGDMRDKSYARVEVAGTKRQIVAGSDSEHAIYEELGTSHQSSHPVIRSVIDEHAPHVTQRIAAARRGR